MRLKSLGRILLLASFLLFLLSCTGETTAVPPSPSIELESTSSPVAIDETTSYSEPPPVQYESHSGDGDSTLTFSSDDLPLEFVLSTLGGTQAIIQTSADRGYESITLLKTRPFIDTGAGITSIEVLEGEVMVQIQSPEEWSLQVGAYTEEHFLSIPGGIIGDTPQTVIIDGAEAKWLRLRWDHDQSVVSIRVFDGGQLVDVLFATSQPYNDWQLLPEDAIALYVIADNAWEIEVAQSKPSSG